MTFRRSPEPEHYIEKYRRQGVSERAISDFCRQKVWEGEKRLKELARSHRRRKYTPLNFPVGVKRIFCNGIDLTEFAFEADFKKGHVKCLQNNGGVILHGGPPNFRPVQVTYHGKLELRDAL